MSKPIQPAAMAGYALSAQLRANAEDCARPDRASLLMHAAVEIDRLVSQIRNLESQIDELESQIVDGGMVDGETI